MPHRSAGGLASRLGLAAACGSVAPAEIVSVAKKLSAERRVVALLELRHAMAPPRLLSW
jgi:hypothetical protein